MKTKHLELCNLYYIQFTMDVTTPLERECFKLMFILDNSQDLDIALMREPVKKYK